MDSEMESYIEIYHYENIRKTYNDFLKNSNMLDLIDVYKKKVVFWLLTMKIMPMYLLVNYGIFCLADRMQ